MPVPVPVPLRLAVALRRTGDAESESLAGWHWQCYLHVTVQLEPLELPVAEAQHAPPKAQAGIYVRRARHGEAPRTCSVPVLPMAVQRVELQHRQLRLEGRGQPSCASVRASFIGATRSNSSCLRIQSLSQQLNCQAGIELVQIEEWCVAEVKVELET